MMPVATLIDRWPDIAEFAVDAGCKLGSAKQMRRRGSIPAAYWMAIVEGAVRRRLDVTYEALAHAHAKPKPDLLVTLNEVA